MTSKDVGLYAFATVRLGTLYLHFAISTQILNELSKKATCPFRNRTLFTTRKSKICQRSNKGLNIILSYEKVNTGDFSERNSMSWPAKRRDLTMRVRWRCWLPCYEREPLGGAILLLCDNCICTRYEIAVYRCVVLEVAACSSQDWWTVNVCAPGSQRHVQRI